MSEKRASEWSASFHRLRTETVVFALLFFAFTHASVSLEKVPVLGVEITGGTPKGPLLVFLLGFWFYFAGTWVLRWLTEPIDEIHEVLGLERIQGLIDGLPARLASPSEMDTEGPTKPLYAALEKFEATISKLPPPETIHRELGIVSNPPPKDDFEGTIEHKRRVIIDSFKYFGDQVAEATIALRTTADGLSSAIATHDLHLIATQKQLESTQQAVPAGLAALEEQTIQIRRALKSVSSAWALYSFWLGFIIPFGFSLALVISSLPAFAHEAFLLFGGELKPCTSSLGWIGWPEQLNQKLPLDLRCLEDIPYR